MTQFQAALPTLLQQQCEGRLPGTPVNVFAQDESRVGLLPSIRRRLTARGVQPVATVSPPFDSFYLFGAVEPTTGASFFLELPTLNSGTFQLWLDHFAQAFPASLNLLVLDNGAFHKAHALQWPSNVAPVFLPPYSPDLNPIERLWRELKAQLADAVAQSLDELSETVCRLLQHYAHAGLKSLTGCAYFVQAVTSALPTANVYS
jgi:transposase